MGADRVCEELAVALDSATARVCFVKSEERITCVCMSTLLLHVSLVELSESVPAGGS